MIKKLLSGLIWVLLANLLVKPFWILGIEVGVQNAVGIEQYGFYIDIFNLAYIFNILLDIGVTNFNTRNIAQHPQLISQHLPSILGIKLALLGLYGVVTLSVGLLSGYGSREFWLLLLLSFNQFLNSLILYLRSNFEGLLLFEWDSLLSVLDRVLMIVICGALLWLPHGHAFTIQYFVYAQTAAYLLAVSIALGLLWSKVGFSMPRLRPTFTLAILRRSLPFALLVLLMASYNRIDPILLNRLLPATSAHQQAGIYAGAFRLLDALTMVAYLVSVPLLPVYARLCAQLKDEPRAAQMQIGHTTRIVFSLMMVFAIAAAATCTHLAPQLMSLLYHDHAQSYANVFRILVLGIVPISITYVFGTLLTAHGSLRQLNCLACITLMINVVANLCLIPRLGAVGSAWASLAAQSFMAASQLLLAMRIFNIRPSARYILKMTLYALLIVSIVGASHLAWWIEVALAVVVSLALSWLLGVVNPKELISILKEK